MLQPLRRSVPDEVSDILRAEILAGTLRPGERLREEAIALRFRVSRGVIREALLSLEHDGLVQRDAHKGSRVTWLQPADIEDILATRSLIEPEAVRRAAGQRLHFRNLRETAARMKAAGLKRDWARYGELDAEFHSELVASAGSDRLATFFRGQTVLLRLAWLRADESEAESRFRPSHLDEHAELLDKIESGDVDAAVSLIEHHLREARRRLLPDADALA